MATDYTPLQGQYLAYLYDYTKMHGVPPAEADMQRFFQVSPPSVHEMVKTLDRKGFITREPGKPRSIRLLLNRAELPDLERGGSRLDRDRWLPELKKRGSRNDSSL